MKAELVIDRLSQLGEGVATSDGRTVFVDGAFPGERVLAQVEPSGRVFRGEVSEILQASPHRREAACPLADRCGGCDWMELDEVAQREAKEEIVLSALEHLGRIPRAAVQVLPAVVSPSALGYRRRAVFHFTGGVLGFHQRRSHAAIAVPRCPALVPELETLPATLSPLLQPIAQDCEAVHLLAEGGQVSMAVILDRVTDRNRRVVEDAVRKAGLRGAVLVPETGPSIALGRPELRGRAPLRPGVPLFLRPDAFAQAHGALAESLVRAGVDAAALRPTDRVLELYAGNGAFTFALGARCAEVTAVESSGTSLELARRSAAEGRVSNIRFVQGDAVKVTQGLVSEGLRFDVLVADPPRTGAAGLAQLAAALGARTVLYIACDAAALARDAAQLVRAGFRPATLELVDMFPQTRHLEAVMAFHRS